VVSARRETSWLLSDQEVATSDPTMSNRLGRQGQALVAVALNASDSLIKVFIVFPDGSTHALGAQQPTQTVLGLKQGLAMVSSTSAGSQHLFVLDDQRDIEDLELKDDEIMSVVLTYSASTTELQLGVIAGNNAAWENLAKLRDATGYGNEGWGTLKMLGARWVLEPSCRNEGWSTLEVHQDPGRCGGVRMDVNEPTEVAYVHLGGAGLTGAPPPAMDQFRCLTFLNLCHNAITGMPSMVHCTVLTEVVLHDNKQLTFEGLEPFCLTPPPNLVKLHIYGCDLEALPALSEFTCLEELNAHTNSLRELPSTIVALTALKRLTLYDNQLEVLPQGFDRLTALRVLDLEENDIYMTYTEITDFKASLPECAINLPMEDANQAVVMDCGSHMIKAGMAGSEVPRANFHTLVGHRKGYTSRAVPGLCVVRDPIHDVLVGEEATMKRGLLQLKYPMERGMVVDWEAMERVWHHTFYNELHVEPGEQPILLTEGPLTTKAHRERVAQIMFDTFGCPALYITMQAVLVLHAAARVTGCVLDSGDGGTHVVCVYEGYIVPHAIMRTDVGGRDITAYMARLLTERGYYFRTSAELEIVREIKEAVTFLKEAAFDELAHYTVPSDLVGIRRGYELPDGNLVDADDVCYRAPEAMFQPGLIGKEAVGVHELVFHSIMKCGIDVRKDLCRQVLLAGGNTMYSGIDQRLCNELAKLAPPHYRFVVIAPLERKFSAWIGGSVICNIAAYRDMWVTKAEYDEVGPQVVHTKCACY
jgi:actin-related protein